MRPLLLKGHERALTQLKYNREGDLIFSVAKDRTASVWYSFNGERLGTFEGHEGTIWSIDVDSASELVLTASADTTVKLWRAETGVDVYSWLCHAPVKRVEFDDVNDRFLAVVDAVMGHKGCIQVYNLNRVGDLGQQDSQPVAEIFTREDLSKVTVAAWSYCSKYIIAGHNNGMVSKYDGNTFEFIGAVEAHEGPITDLQFSDDGTYFITSSKDKSAQILEVDELVTMKKYKADAPINSASITPLKNFVILGGGQDAKDVTTTAASQGKFESRFYHKIFQDEIGRVKGHFGPLNCIAVHPKGTSFSSGGEDGYVRVHTFDKSYYDFKYDVEILAESSVNK